MAAQSYESATPCVVGQQISIRGTLVGEEDLIVEGRIEGGVTLAGHLTVAQAGVLEANLDVDSIEVWGEVVGDITASRSITIQKGARVHGNVSAPRVIIHDGASFHGAVEMEVKLPDALAKSIR